MTKLARLFAAALSSIMATPTMAEATTEVAANAAAASETTDDAGAASQASAEVKNDGAWEFAVTPYLWASSVSGDVELAQGEQVEIDTSFSDILSSLKFAGMGAFDARHDHFVLLGDIIYLSLGADADGPLGFVDADVDMSTFLGTALAGYRVVDEGPLFLDFFGGGRFISIDAEVGLTGPLQSIDRDGSTSSFGPVVGARFRTPLGGRWGVAVYGDVGGFGVSDTKTWQLLGTVQYDVSDHWRLGAGYRHVHVHHDQSEFEVDLSMSGPFFAFGYRF